MAPETRLAAVLFGSFLVWFPALSAFLRGDLDAGAVGVRFAAAVAVVWGGIALLTTIVSGYRTEPLAAADDGGGVPQRRAEDRTGQAVDRDVPAGDASAAPVSDASGG